VIVKGVGAGLIIVALFLCEFVGECCWVYFDIVGFVRSECDVGLVGCGGIGYGV